MDGKSKSEKTRLRGMSPSEIEKKCKSSSSLADSQTLRDAPSLNAPDTHESGLEHNGSSGSNVKLKGNHSVEPECEARLTKLLEYLRDFMNGNGNDNLLGLADGRNLLHLLLCSAVFDEDYGWVFFGHDLHPSEEPTLIVGEDLIHDLVHACATQTSKLIVQDLGDDYFGIGVDVFCDREGDVYLLMRLRYVDERGEVMEHILGIKQLADGDNTAVSLKSAVDSLLREHSLDSSKIRGQSVNKDCNATVETHLNGLMTLVMEETKSAYYVDCFAQNLQSRLSAVAKNQVLDCYKLFMPLEDLANLVSESCKQKEKFQEITTEKFLEAFGLHQEFAAMRIDKFCSGLDQYKSLQKIVSLFPVIDEVLYTIETYSTIVSYQSKAGEISSRGISFDFAFLLHLMNSIAGYTNELSLAVQRNDIVNLVSLLPMVKEHLQRMKDNGWETLLNDVCAFCTEHNIKVPDMGACYYRVPRRVQKEVKEQLTNLQYYRADVFLRVIDLHLEELNFLFNEVSVELLNCIACLSPADNFSAFDSQKIVRLTQFYPHEFSSVDMLSIKDQLDKYILCMRTDERFLNLADLKELTAKLVETKMHIHFSLVYLLLRLVLVLPVETPNYAIASFGVSCLKHQLKSCNADQVYTDFLILLVEKRVFSRVSNEDILNCLQAIRASRKQV